jgi:hypothetical protein
MMLDALGVLSLYLMRSLQKGFYGIRQFAVLPNRHLNTAIAKCRDLIRGANSGSCELADRIVPTKCVPEAKPEVHCCVACGSQRVLLFDMPARRVDAQLTRPHFPNRLERVALDWLNSS